MTKKRIYLSILILTFCVLWGYFFFYKNYSNAGVFKNVTERDGYTLNLIKDKEAVEFYIKPEWILVNGASEKKYAMELTSKNNTNIILDTVLNRENDIYFSFETTYNMNYHKGSFMYNMIFNENGSFTSYSSHTDFYFYNNNNEIIDVGHQTGRGPGSSFGFAIDSEDYDLIKDGFYVNYSGFNLYEYYKN